MSKLVASTKTPDPLPVNGMADGNTAEVPAESSARPVDGKQKSASGAAAVVPEFGGPDGPEPTRFGDWERKGRCIDF